LDPDLLCHPRVTGPAPVAGGVPSVGEYARVLVTTYAYDG